MATDITVPESIQSGDLESLIRERVASLQEEYLPFDDCRNVVRVPDRHRRFARHFQVRLELTRHGVPPLVLIHESSLHRPPKDASEAVDQAFEAARKRLHGLARLERGSLAWAGGDGPTR
jgi:hypothetical protein